MSDYDDVGLEEYGVPHGSDGGHTEVSERFMNKKSARRPWTPPEHTDSNADHASSNEEVDALRKAGAL